MFEHLQVPLAQVREQFGIPGMDAATARNFRDKAQMKSVLRAAGVPCARYRLADSAAAAAGFADEVGYPLVVKPPAGAGAKSTFRLDDAGDLKVWLDAAPPTPGSPALLEEFLTGDEGSYDSVMTDGQVVWDSVSRYLPTPLEVLRNPWIQWAVLHAPGHRRPRVRRHPGDRADGAARARAADRADPHGVVPAPRRHGRGLRGRGAAAGRPDHLDAVLRARLRPVPRLGAAHGVRQLHAAPNAPGRSARCSCAARGRAMSGGCTASASCRPRSAPSSIESRLPQAGQVSSASYEGDGYVIVRHPDTAVVTDALRRLVTTVRVELG